jgi:hypothetical protein
MPKVNLLGFGSKGVAEDSTRQMHLEVLLAELKARDEFLQSQIKNEASNFLAVLGSVGAAGTIYAGQVFKAQSSGQEIPATLILGLAVAFLWFPMNQGWHMAELRAAELYIDELAFELRKIVAAPKNSQMLTWPQFRLKEIRPRWGRWYVSLAMTARGAILYVPSVSLTAYCLWGLTGDGTFNRDDALQWALLVTVCLGVCGSALALILPYIGKRYRREIAARAAARSAALIQGNEHPGYCQ